MVQKTPQKKKSNLEIINENLPLITSQYPLEQVEQAKKKLKFVKENAGLFPSTGSYIMTLDSVKRELEKYEKERSNELKKLDKKIKASAKRREESEVRKFNEYLKSGRRTY